MELLAYMTFYSVSAVIGYYMQLETAVRRKYNNSSYETIFMKCYTLFLIISRNNSRYFRSNLRHVMNYVTNGFIEGDIY